jgi:GPH family glycoside/pentoside/hexuronide:cation symporter
MSEVVSALPAIPASVTADEDRVPLVGKLVYGLGGLVNNLLAAAMGGMMIVLNLGLGMNPALVGLLGALPRLTDALTDPIMGFISDRTRSRWGRRRPYIFVGAVSAALCFALLWQLPEGESESYYFWYFLFGSMVFFLAYTVFATPWVALGYELTPDYHERTRVMGVQNFMSQLAYLIAPWFLWFMQLDYFGDIVEGAAKLAILIALVTVTVGILPALFLRERFVDIPVSLPVAERRTKSLGESVKEFGQGFVATMACKPFLKLCAATFLVFNGFMLVASFQFYVIIYYVFAGDQQQGAIYAGWAGTVSAVATFCVIILATWMSGRIGKRRAFFVCTGVSIFGYGLKWFCYDPEIPLLLLVPAPFIAFGLGGLFTLMGSMMADVCDFDELTSHERREGMFGSIFWWVVKLGMALALALGGVLLNVTGFDVALEGAQSADTIFLMRLFDAVVPMLTSALAIYAIATYPITEARAESIRNELETRRLA